MPAVPRYVPEDWTAIMRPALYGWARDAASTYGIAADRIIWKHQTAPAPAKPYVAIGTLTPAVPEGEPWQSGPRAIRVTAVLNVTLYRVTINGINCDYTSDATATMTEILAGLIAAIVAGFGAGAAASSPHFADVLLLSDSLPSGAVISTSAQLAARLVHYKVGESNFTLSVDVYSDVAAGEAESIASAVVSAMARSLCDEPRLEALRVAGIAVVGIDGMRRFPSARDGAWEDRAGFDVLLRALTRTASLIDWIEDAGTLSGTFTA